MVRVEAGEEEGGRRFYWLEGEAPSKPASDDSASGVFSSFLLTSLVEDWGSLDLLSLENHLQSCLVLATFHNFPEVVNHIVTEQVNVPVNHCFSRVTLFNNGLFSRPIEAQFFNFSTGNVTTSSLFLC